MQQDSIKIVPRKIDIRLQLFRVEYEYMIPNVSLCLLNISIWICTKKLKFITASIKVITFQEYAFNSFFN